jgi:cold shock CspA family protein
MNVGIIYRYFPLSKFGFIKTLEESIFFHFSNVKDYIHRKDVVIFDIIDTPKGKSAINVRLLEKDEAIKKKLLETGNPLFRWLVVKNDIKLYEIEKELFNKKVQIELNDLFINQDEYLNLYVNQFSTKQFWENYKIIINKDFGSLGGSDWTEAWWSYSILSKYKINYKFDINFFSYKLNFESYGGKIEVNFKDLYINDYLHYYRFLHTEEYYNDLHFDKNSLNVSNDELNSIRNEKIEKFKTNYNKEDHLKSLENYRHKSVLSTPLLNYKFESFLSDKINEFLLNNSENNEILRASQKEIKEDLENYL